MADVPALADDLVDALAVSVAAVIPLLKSRIPPVPAAQLGRIGAPPAAAGGRSRHLAEPLLAERLLGALELTLPGLPLGGIPDLSEYLPDSGGPARPRAAASTVRKKARPGLGEPLLPSLKLDPSQPRARAVSVMHVAGESEAMAAARTLERFRPGSADLTVALCRRLCGHRLVAPLLDAAPEKVPDGPAAEEHVAAAHGAAYLALGVAVAWAVTGQGQVLRGPAVDLVAAAVGLGVNAARELLGEVPMPEAYAAALLERVRAEYLLPRAAYGKVLAAGNRIALSEGTFPDATDFSRNGLVAVVPGGAVIRTGRQEGTVTVTVHVSGEEPKRPRTESWDEVVEVSWHADEGLASVVGPGGAAASGGPADRRAAFTGDLRRLTPPWPGDYRLRVHATGRDDADGEERYELHVWQAPPAPEIVHKRTDRVGHRLRGEPEPDPRPEPWRKYRAICDTVLDIHGTITVVIGSSSAEVVRAFGADPGHPRSLSELEAEELQDLSLESSIAVLPVTMDRGESGAIVIESNGFHGSTRSVLEQASASGRAASFHQNAKGMTILSFAEGGRVLESYEPFGPPNGEAGPEVQAAVEGLDFADVRDHGEKCLFAVERFAGCGITPADVEQIRSADVGYRVQE